MLSWEPAPQTFACLQVCAPCWRLQCREPSPSQPVLAGEKDRDRLQGTTPAVGEAGASSGGTSGSWGSGGEGSEGAWGWWRPVSSHQVETHSLGPLWVYSHKK